MLLQPVGQLEQVLGHSAESTGLLTLWGDDAMFLLNVRIRTLSCTAGLRRNFESHDLGRLFKVNRRGLSVVVDSGIRAARPRWRFTVAKSAD